MSEPETGGLLVGAAYEGHWQMNSMVGNVRRASCGHLAWFTDEGEAQAAQRDLQTICLPCFDRLDDREEREYDMTEQGKAHIQAAVAHYGAATTQWILSQHGIRYDPGT